MPTALLALLIEPYSTAHWTKQLIEPNSTAHWTKQLIEL